MHLYWHVILLSEHWRVENGKWSISCDITWWIASWDGAVRSPVFVRRRIGRPATTQSSRVHLEPTMCLFNWCGDSKTHFSKGSERLNRSDNLRGPNFPYCVAIHRSPLLYCRIVLYKAKQYTRSIYVLIAT